MYSKVRQHAALLESSSVKQHWCPLRISNKGEVGQRAKIGWPEASAFGEGYSSQFEKVLTQPHVASPAFFPQEQSFHLKQKQQSESSKYSRMADAFKAEGNKLFASKDFEGAM